MSIDNVIEVKNLSKSYKLYSSAVDRLKESLHPLRKQYYSEFYALRDVSFGVQRGQCVGIIGKNGSGKSTLLKMLSGVVTPTFGDIQIQGKVSALLELGAGFNPELSGIENVYFNGMLNGLSKEEIDRKMEDVLEFADIGRFIKQPVKTYSSGMFIRLAFAVALSVDPDILIIDEALAVGDIKFQRKCYSKIENLYENNKTILFVSHSIDSINLLCSYVLMLHDGQLVKAGNPKEVTFFYQRFMNDENNTELSDLKVSSVVETRGNSRNISLSQNEDDKCFEKYRNLVATKLLSWDGHKRAEIFDYGILDEDDRNCNILRSGGKYSFYSKVLVYTSIEKIHIGFQIKNTKGLFLFAVNSEVQRIAIPTQEKGNVLYGKAEITMWLAPGDYFLTFRTATRDEDFDELTDKIHFVVIGPVDQVSGALVNLNPKMEVKNIYTTNSLVER